MTVDPQKREPFYFKSYGMVIGAARNLNDLQDEFERLAQVNPDALIYHLKQGHISGWLNYINEKELAEELKHVKTIEEARIKMNIHRQRNLRENSLPFHKERPRN